ncbi:MAG TPA: cation:proton antiporter [Acidobacteriota bacterium]|nr:cation:proton antiporter [Acidobacteriota bacterium]
MQDYAIIRDLVIVFGCTAPIVYLFHRLKQPPVIGFMITGALIGPFGFSLIGSVESVRTLAIVGLMILLFSVGLEFSVKKLLELRRAVLIAGPLQLVGTTLLIALVATRFGVSFIDGIVYGILLSQSSTAIIIKVLEPRREVDSVHGRVGMGVSIFQDLSTVPLVIAIPLMAASQVSLADIASILLKSILLIAAVVFSGRYIFPALLRTVLRTKNRELFLISSVFIFFATAWVSSSIGVSLALGSFLAGLILSDSEYGHHIFAEIRPFRDGLNSLFFVSIGMFVNPGLLFANPWVVVGVLAATIAGKFLIATLAAMALRIPLHVAALAGFSLAQVGEFSFILLIPAAAAGIVSDTPYQIILACSVMSMMVIPLLYGPARKLIGRRALKWKPRSSRAYAPEQAAKPLSEITDHVIICGFGLSGRNISRVLKGNGIPYVIIDLNEEMVREARVQEEPAYFGDCTSTHTLKLMGIKRARAVVFVISDPFAAWMAVGAARELKKEIVILTRTKYVADIDALWDQGSTEVVSEEFEASLELLTRVLRLYNTPRAMIAEEIKTIRSRRFGLFREPTVPRIRLSNDLEVFSETWRAPDKDWVWNGSRIDSTRLREETGCLIMGIIRENQALNNPKPDELLLNGDSLVLSGTKNQIHSAILLLSSGRTLLPKTEPASSG